MLAKLHQVFRKLSDRTQKTIEVSFYLLFAVIPLFWTPITSEVFELNKMLGIYLLTTIIVGAWGIKSVLSGKIIFKHSLLDLPLLLFLLSQIVSTYFSIDQHLSVWGYYSRLNGGLVSTITFCLLYWAYVSNMSQANTLYTIRYTLYSASMVAVWAILEHFGHSPSCIFLRGEFNVDCWVQDVQRRPFATLGQPNWLASFLAAITPFGWILLPATKSVSQGETLRNQFLRIFPILLSATLFLAIIFTQSRAGLYGYIAAYFVFWAGVFLTNHKPRQVLKKFSLLSLSLLIITLLFGTRLTPSLHNILKPQTTNYNLPATYSPGGTESGDIRKIVWQGAIDIWKNYPYFGSGPEAFAETYYNFRPKEHNQTSEWDLLYNKAHNEFLNYLANTGLFGAGAYLTFISASFFLILKNLKLKIKNSNIVNLSLISGLIGLNITNFFGFSISVTNTLLFLYPAFAISLQVQSTQKIVHRKINLQQFTFFLLVLCTMSYVLFTITSLWLADYHYNQAGKLMRKGLYSQSLEHIQTTVKIRPDEPLYSDKLAQIVSYLALTEKEGDHLDRAQELANISERASNVALSISPRNLTLLKSQAVIMNRLAQVDTSYLTKAATPLEKAIELAPTDPEVHYNLGAIYSSLDKNQKALVVLQKAIELKSDYYDARVGLAQVYTKLKQKELAYKQYLWILNNLNPDDEEVRTALEQLLQN